MEQLKGAWNIEIIDATTSTKKYQVMNPKFLLVRIEIIVTSDSHEESAWSQLYEVFHT